MRVCGKSCSELTSTSEELEIVILEPGDTYSDATSLSNRSHHIRVTAEASK